MTINKLTTFNGYKFPIFNCYILTKNFSSSPYLLSDNKSSDKGDLSPEHNKSSSSSIASEDKNSEGRSPTPDYCSPAENNDPRPSNYSSANFPLPPMYSDPTSTPHSDGESVDHGLPTSEQWRKEYKNDSEGLKSAYYATQRSIDSERKEERKYQSSVYPPRSEELKDQYEIIDECHRSKTVRNRWNYLEAEKSISENNNLKRKHDSDSEESEHDSNRKKLSHNRNSDDEDNNGNGSSASGASSGSVGSGESNNAGPSNDSLRKEVISNESLDDLPYSFNPLKTESYSNGFFSKISKLFLGNGKYPKGESPVDYVLEEQVCYMPDI